MSQYLFGVSRRRVTSQQAQKIEEIAAKHNVDFYQARIPGTGYQSWFGGPDRGAPVNERLQSAVMADIRQAGIFLVELQAICAS